MIFVMALLYVLIAMILQNIYGTHGNTPSQLREYIFNKSNKDIYVTNPNLLYQIPSLLNNEFEF